MMDSVAQGRALGKTNINVSPVAMGCWPIAGMTSPGVNDDDSIATLNAALDAGINFFDTAYCYGRAGESERLIARALGDRRDEIVIATKGGIHWDENGKQMLDARPRTILRECEESLRRLETDRVELLYLHAPDPETPIAETAEAFGTLLAQGKTLGVGVSNCTTEQMAQFQEVCPITAIQPPYNMLQRQIEKDALPWCRERDIAVIIYWPLMKGLLAGKISRDHVLPKGDSRNKYPMFQGEERQRNHDFVDQLKAIAESANKTVAQLVVAWTIHQPGITAALCGAKYPNQIQETAVSATFQLSDAQLRQIDEAIAARGEAAVRMPV